MTRTELKRLCTLYGWVLLPKRIAMIDEGNRHRYDYTAIKLDLSAGVYLGTPKEIATNYFSVEELVKDLTAKERWWSVNLGDNDDASLVATLKFYMRQMNLPLEGV